MFSSVSWSQYISFIICSLVIYYMVITVLFYRKELSSLIKQGKNHHTPPVSAKEEHADQHLLEELYEVQAATQHREFSREELMMTIMQKLKQYSGVNKGKINQYITEAFPQLEEADRRRIWH